MPSTPLPLILASSSPYRRELLQRLIPTFITANPDIDESPLPGESPTALVERLSAAKAMALTKTYRQHYIIGSDQVATCRDTMLTKPGCADRARQQLRQQSGQVVLFHTGLCLLNSKNGARQVDTISTRVRFRELTDDEITRYVARENPIDCAGSFRCEALGISLFESVESPDPTALIGLPLIRLAAMLRNAAFQVP